MFDPPEHPSSDQPSEQASRPLDSQSGQMAIRPSEMIHCALPMDDADYREIVIDFVRRLDIRLATMSAMLDSCSFDDLRNEAHWLKGSGGTVGYGAFTAPAIELMKGADARDTQDCELAMQAILRVRERLIVPSP